MHLLFSIIVGGIAGWLGSKIINGTGLGILFDILLGLAGGFVGDIILGLFGFHYSDNGFIPALATGTLGAVVLLGIAKLVRGGM